MNEKLKYVTADRWYSLWHKLGGPVGYRNFTAYQDLIKKYAEPHRKYHNIFHVESCLAEFADVKELALNPRALELAIWYHDVVYNINANDNEEQSAVFAGRAIAELFPFPEALTKSVAEIILATKHNSVPESYDAKLMLDIDIVNIGRPEVFKITNRLVQEEYASVTEKRFIEGRSNILELFLARPRIYLTDYFYEKYEVAARKNIAEALAELNGK